MNFNDKNFQDVLRLAEDAKQDQIADLSHKRFDLIISPKILITRMEITAKLGLLISWFFYQKAVENGEMSAKEALRQCPSLCESCAVKTCKGERTSESLCLKSKFYSRNFFKLKKESDALYCRVARVDYMMRNKKTVAV